MIGTTEQVTPVTQFNSEDGEREKTTNKFRKFLPLFSFQILLLILFLVFVRYKDQDGNARGVKGFEDTHVMIFVGFGFLMTFLFKYCYNAVGKNLLLASLAIQWAFLCQNFFHMDEYVIKMTKLRLIEADVMAATVLITFGALLGVASVTQLLMICIIEVAVGCVNIYLVTDVLKANDVGGSIAIHAFGAYFGLAVSFVMRVRNPDKTWVTNDHKNNKPNYYTDVFAMIGSLFLFIYWPSFNSALTNTDAEYERAVCNTYLSIAAGAVTAFVMSALVHEEGKWDMVHIQNSTLAGGVAIGTFCDMNIWPGFAILTGIFSGILSVVGYKFLTPKLSNKGLLDTCGVHNLHGMPGVLSALLSVIAVFIQTKDSEVSKGDSRTVGTQALFQLAALLSTLAMAIVGGVITGLIVKSRLFTKIMGDIKYSDEPNWELPEHINDLHHKDSIK